MSTLASLKKQMAALETRMAKATKAEMGGAIAKIHKIMADFGLTIEHLASGAARGRLVAKKAAAGKNSPVKGSAKPKGSKPPKYLDPTTGATWAGVGRAPTWIVNATNRDEFLIRRPSAGTTAAAKKAARPVASVKQSMADAAEKKASRKPPAVKKAAITEAAESPVAAKKAGVKKAGVKKVATKKTARKKVAAKMPAGEAVAKKATSKTTTAGAANTAAALSDALPPK